MTRRKFIAGIGGAAVVAWPLVARAQPAKLPTIGFLGASIPSTQTRWTAAFVQRLRELGWIEGKTIAIEYRWAEGRNERFVEIAAEFVRLKVDVIVTPGSATLAAKAATSTIPIVFAAASDPVGSGLVASLARPGGNVTGLSLQNPELAGKRLELLRELRPNLRQLAILTNTSYSAALLERHQVEVAASALGFEVMTLEVLQTKDIAIALDTIKGKADALYVTTDPLMNTNRMRINTLALGLHLSTIYGEREFVEAGGLISYGPNFSDLYGHAADLVDKVLRGTKPADIPVEQPTKFDLVINLITAKALEIDVPSSLLTRADEVIE